MSSLAEIVGLSTRRPLLSPNRSARLQLIWPCVFTRSHCLSDKRLSDKRDHHEERGDAIQDRLEYVSGIQLCAQFLKPSPIVALKAPDGFVDR